MAKLVGLYTGAEQLINDPHYFEVLKEELGLNLVIIGGPFDLSSETRAKNPVISEDGTKAPGTGLTRDDTQVRQAIEIAHQYDLQVWFCICAWWAGAEAVPELIMVDFLGQRMDKVTQPSFSTEGGSHTFCPNNPKVRAWFTSACADIAKLYPGDGFDLTHARYYHPAFYPALFGCACDYCAETAGELGYNFPVMRAACLRALKNMRKVSAHEVVRISEQGVGFVGFLEYLAQDTAVGDWFNYRCDNICGRLGELKQAVDSVVDRKFTFGSDTHVPTFAHFVGHRYSEFSNCSSYTSPLLPHFQIHYLLNLVSIADWLEKTVQGLNETEALHSVYRFFGYDGFNLPDKIADFGLFQPDTETRHESLYYIVESEMRKARRHNTGGIPSYPVIKGQSWPSEIIKGLMKAADEMGHEGIIFQGTSGLVEYPKK